MADVDYTSSLQTQMRTTLTRRDVLRSSLAAVAHAARSATGSNMLETFNYYGDYLSGMARLSKALDYGELRAKALRLMAEWAKTIEPDGYFFYSRKPVTPHYIYDKMMCGLVDLYEFAHASE